MRRAPKVHRVRKVPKVRKVAKVRGGRRLGRGVAVVVAVLMATSPGLAQVQVQPTPPLAQAEGSSYLVFVRQRPVGREQVAVIRDADGWTIRGASQLGVPIDLTTKRAEVKYDAQWRPISVVIESVAQGADLELRTTFADGKASNEIIAQGKPTAKVDTVSPDAIVLPNTFLGSYAALAYRLQSATAGQELRAYIAPQIEVPIRVVQSTTERIETPRQTIASTRFALKVVNPAPAGEIDLNVWIDEKGQLLRMSVPAQTLELARDDIASAASRTASFSIPGDVSVLIPAAGFNLAGTVTKPSTGDAPFPVIVLIGGSGPTDRDETVSGIPVFGQLARGLVTDGWLVVRYDKRGVGQSGGRTESVTLSDYAEDARAVVRFIEKHPDADKNRIALVGHSEGAAVAMILATREDDRVKAIVLAAGSGTTGAELVLEQQRHALDMMKVDATERAAKIALQERIHAAVLKGAGWTDVPDQLRRAADTPWFQSFLSFDPARVMRDIEQPVFIVQGELDTQVPPHHADTLAEMGKARKRKVPTDVLLVPGVNHLFVPAKTGEVSEYATLGESAEVSPAVTSGISAWLKKTLGTGKK
jgi:pimeloyl-ACP methyl ester carboxylesterase